MTQINAFYRRSVSLVLFFLLTGTVSLKAWTIQDADSLAHGEEDRRKFDFYFYEALNAKVQGNYDVAFDLFQHCYAMDSTNASVLVELGTFYNVLQEKQSLHLERVLRRNNYTTT